MIFGDTVKQVRELLGRDFMISKIHRPDSDEHHEIVNGHTVLNEDDVVFIVAHPAVQEPIIALLGEQVEMDWEQFGNELITRRISSPNQASTARPSARCRYVPTWVPTLPE